MGFASKLPVVGVATLFACGAVTSPAHAAGGSPAYECTSSNGVWVVVAYHGSPTASGCYRGGGTGLQALAAITSVKQKPNGLICRVNGLPDTSYKPDPCNPLDATNSPFWFYYYKIPASGGWEFSNLGAQNRSVVPGSVEGWNFGTGQYPFDPPPAPDLAAPAPTPVPVPGNTGGGSSAPGPAPTSSNNSSNGGTVGGAGSTAAGSPSPGDTAAGSPTADPSSASPSASPSAGPGESATATDPAATTSGPGPASPGVTAEASAPKDAPTGSPVATIVTLGVLGVAALGGAAWWKFGKKRSS